MQWLLARDTKGFAPFPRQIGLKSVFIGRQDQLSLIHANYKENRKHNIPIIQMITGAGGMGKTDTASEYARQHRKDYPDGVFFFCLESRLTFFQSVRENLVAMKLQTSGSPNEDFQRLQLYFQTNPHCLFIYDNADDLSIVEEFLPAISSPLHILVTTRRISIDSSKLQHAHTLQLQPLNIHTAMQLLLTLSNHPLLLQQLQQDHPSEYQHALNIVGPQMVDCLPLGIVHTAGLVRRQRGKKTERLKESWETLEKNRGHLSIEPKNVEEWLHNYHLSGIRMQLVEELHVSSLHDLRSLTDSAIQDSSLTHKEKRDLMDARDDLVHCPVIGPWKMDIDTVCAENSYCRPLLEAASLLPSRDIPVSVLHSYLLATCEEVDEAKFNAAVYLLTDRSLLSYSEDEETLTVHPLIQQTFQQFVIDKDSKRQVVLSSLSATFVKLLPSVHEVRTGQKLSDGKVIKYSSHLYHVASLILECACESEVSHTAVDFACILAIRLENVSVASSLCPSRLTFDRKNEKKERLIQSLVDVATVKAMQHKASESNAFCQDAMAMMGDGPVSTETTEEWALLMVDIVGTYRDLGMYAQVEALASKTKTILEAAGSTDCYVYATCLNLLALCHSYNRQYGNAERVSRAAVRIYKQCVPHGHPDVGTELANLGSYCLEQQKCQDAEKFLVESLDINRQSLPSQHPKIVATLRLMGELYIEWGKLDKAEKCLTEALDIIHSAYLDQHEEAAQVMSLMGRCYLKQGKTIESERLHRQALNLTIDLCGGHHHQTAVEYCELGQCLYEQKRYREAKTELHTALKIETNVAGRGHPSTASILYWLSLCYKHTDDYQKSLSLMTEAVEIMKSRLGDSNPETLTMQEELQSLHMQAERNVNFHS